MASIRLIEWGKQIIWVTDKKSVTCQIRRILCQVRWTTIERIGLARLLRANGFWVREIVFESLGLGWDKLLEVLFIRMLCLKGYLYPMIYHELKCKFMKILFRRVLRP